MKTKKKAENTWARMVAELVAIHVQLLELDAVAARLKKALDTISMMPKTRAAIIAHANQLAKQQRPVKKLAK